VHLERVPTLLAHEMIKSGEEVRQNAPLAVGQLRACVEAS
jgi:hypothetical protein